MLLAAGPATLPQVRPDADVPAVEFPMTVWTERGHVAGLYPSDLSVTLSGGRRAKVEQLREVDAVAGGPGRQLLLVFDLSHPSVPSLLRARDAALVALSGLGPADLVSVATLSASHGARLLLASSPDRAQLRRSLHGLGLLDENREPDPLLLAYDLRPAAESEPARYDELAAELRSRGAVAGPDPGTRANSLRFLRELAALIAAFGELRGPAHVALFSSGFREPELDSGWPGDGLLGGPSQAMPPGDGGADPEGYDELPGAAMPPPLAPPRPDPALSRAAERVVEVARGAGVTIHVARLDSPRVEGAGPTRPLAGMAEDTGGAVWKGSDEQGFARMLERTRRYYLVTTRAPATGRSPTALEVESLKRGWTVGYRRILAVEPRSTQTVPGLLRASARIAEGGPSGEIELRGLVVSTGTGSSSLLVQLLGMPLLEPVEAPELTLQVYAYVFARDGSLRDYLAIAPRLVLREVGDAMWRTGLTVQTGFDLGPGLHRIAVLVVEDETHRHGVFATDVSVPERAAHGLLAPPLFAEARESWLVLGAPSKLGATWSAQFEIGEQLFVPNLFPRLEPGRLQRLCLLMRDAEGELGPGTPLAIGARLIDAAGAGVSPGRISVLASEATPGGLLRFALGLTPGAVSAGDYTLRLRVRDPEGRLVAAGAQTVVVP